MKLTILLILIFAFTTFGQKKAVTVYTFPETDSEFTVIFPQKPDIKTVFGARDRSGLVANLVLGGQILKAELMEITLKNL